MQLADRVERRVGIPLGVWERRLFCVNGARPPLGEGPAPELALPPRRGLLQGMKCSPFRARLNVDERKQRAVERHDILDELGGRHAPILPKRGTMVRPAGSLAPSLAPLRSMAENRA